MDRLALLNQLAEKVRATRKSAALATVTETSGSTPQEPGAKMALFQDGTLLGTIGGGAVEEHVKQQLQACLASAHPRSIVRHLTRDLAMCCGGSMTIFVEPFLPPPRLVLFGAGHIARPCAAIARAAGFEVVIVDAREELNHSERFPDCRLMLDEGDDLFKSGELALGREDYVIICTHSHQLDEQLVELCARQPARFLGMVGSRRKSEVIQSRIRLRVPELDISHLVSPVGLPIGAMDPEEIAVSIVAQLIDARRKTQEPNLRTKDEPVVGVILAAGLASRMGRNKALGRIGPATVLETIHRTLLEGGCDAVCVVVSEPLASAIMDAHPSYWYELSPGGADMSTSFRTGLLAAQSRKASTLVLATLDQPHVLPSTVRDLIFESRKNQSGVRPAHQNNRGHPIVVSAQVALPPQRQEETLRELLSRAFSFAEMATEDAAVLDNLNTIEDAKRLGVRFSDQ